MREHCEFCGKFTELEKTQNYQGDGLYLCPDCLSKAEVKMETEIERQTEGEV